MNVAVFAMPRNGSFRSCAAAWANESRSTLLRLSSALSTASRRACATAIPIDRPAQLDGHRQVGGRPRHAAPAHRGQEDRRRPARRQPPAVRAQRPPARRVGRPAPRHRTLAAQPDDAVAADPDRQHQRPGQHGRRAAARRAGPRRAGRCATAPGRQFRRAARPGPPRPGSVPCTVATPPLRTTTASQSITCSSPAGRSVHPRRQVGGDAFQQPGDDRPGPFPGEPSRRARAAPPGAATAPRRRTRTPPAPAGSSALTPRPWQAISPHSRPPASSDTDIDEADPDVAQVFEVERRDRPQHRQRQVERLTGGRQHRRDQPGGGVVDVRDDPDPVALVEPAGLRRDVGRREPQPQPRLPVVGHLLGDHLARARRPTRTGRRPPGRTR